MGAWPVEGCVRLSWTNLNFTMPLTSATHIYLAVLCVLTCHTFQKETTLEDMGVTSVGSYGFFGG